MIYRKKLSRACVLTSLVALGLLAGACIAAESAKTPSVLGAGVPPVATVVKRIAGEGVEVQTLIPSNQDPHTFEPSTRQIQGFGKVEIYFSIGLPFETILVEKIASSHGKMKVVDITANVRRKLGQTETPKLAPSPATGVVQKNRPQVPGTTSRKTGAHQDHKHAHAHGASCDCAEGNVDLHVWLSPQTLRQLALNIQKTLDEVDPAGVPSRKERCDALYRELDELDKKLTKQLEPYRGRTIYVYHPSLGYFCEAYGLKQKAIETGGREPTTRWLQTLIRQARSEGVRTIFVQKQFDQRAAKIVARAIDGQVEPIDPLAPDVIANLKRIGDVVVRGQ